MRCFSKALPHPDVPRSGLEGGLQITHRPLEACFEALRRGKGHLRMRLSASMIDSSMSSHRKIRSDRL
ncbi:hypothetical protein FV220_02965 [Methylobacterium sp. WL19]|nr:hypothetical protein FV220_02965 [Methylobacterium sp. WL19]